jgi:microcystin-dependent protein
MKIQLSFKSYVQKTSYVTTWIVLTLCCLIQPAFVTGEPGEKDSDVGLVTQVPPIGVVLAYAGKEIDEKKTGWLLCDGRWLSVPKETTDQYWSVYQVIGDTYGSEVRDNRRFFRLPDLRGRIPVGLDNMGGSSAGVLINAGEMKGGLNGNTLGACGGESTHKLVSTEVPSHTHDVKDGGHLHSARLKLGGVPFVAALTLPPGAPQISQSSSSVAVQVPSARGLPGVVESGVANIKEQTRGGDQPHNNIQPSIVLNYIIRYR